MAGEKARWKAEHLQVPLAYCTPLPCCRSSYGRAYYLGLTSLKQCQPERRNGDIIKRTQMNKYIHENEEDSKDSPTKEKRERLLVISGWLTRAPQPAHN